MRQMFVYTYCIKKLHHERAGIACAFQYFKYVIDDLSVVIYIVWYLFSEVVRRFEETWTQYNRSYCPHLNNSSN